MSEGTLEQLLGLLKETQQENVKLRERITELSTRNNNPVALSQLQEKGLSNIRRTELSNSTQSTLDRATDLVIKYGKLVGFT